jgi:hypothetical protein
LRRLPRLASPDRAPFDHRGDCALEAAAATCDGAGGATGAAARDRPARRPATRATSRILRKCASVRLRAGDPAPSVTPFVADLLNLVPGAP